MKVVVICGPTASGKTALAVESAKILNGEVVSADALLVYKKLNIGTAKPCPEEMCGIPHHMIDIIDPTENFSVSDYERLALPILQDISARGKTPILCGGTGFYIHALLYSSGYGMTPASPSLREKYETIARQEGRERLHQMLRDVDPESADLLHYNDVKRVIRALEIFELTGKKKSEQTDKKIARFPFIAFSFQFPREILYSRIEQRVDSMLKEGLVDEVKKLLESGVPENAQCMQGIGYKEVVEFLKNGTLHSTMSDIIKKNTRNYAKRQITFFKNMENLHWIPPMDVREAAREVMRIYDCQ